MQVETKGDQVVITLSKMQTAVLCSIVDSARVLIVASINSGAARPEAMRKLTDQADLCDLAGRHLRALFDDKKHRR